MSQGMCSRFFTRRFGLGDSRKPRGDLMVSRHHPSGRLAGLTLSLALIIFSGGQPRGLGGDLKKYGLYSTDSVGTNFAAWASVARARDSSTAWLQLDEKLPDTEYMDMAFSSTKDTYEVTTSDTSMSFSRPTSARVMTGVKPREESSSKFVFLSFFGVL